MNDYDYEEQKTMNLEDLIEETEQKILDNTFYEDCEVEYRNLILKCRIKPISQVKFIRLLNKANSSKNGDAKLSSDIIRECLLNKETNEPFTMKQINELFTGGLALAVANKCVEVSGIDLDEATRNQNRNF